MFVAGLDVGPDRAEGFGVGRVGEPAGDLVVELAHPQRPLHVVVCRRYSGVIEQHEDLGSFSPEAGGEVPGVAGSFGVQRPRFPQSWWRPGWEDLERLVDDLVVTFPQTVGDTGVDCPVVGGGFTAR